MMRSINILIYSHWLEHVIWLVLKHPSMSVVMNTCSETSDIIKKAYLHLLLVISDNSHSHI